MQKCVLTLLLAPSLIAYAQSGQAPASCSIDQIQAPDGSCLSMQDRSSPDRRDMAHSNSWGGGSWGGYGGWGGGWGGNSGGYGYGNGNNMVNAGHPDPYGPDMVEYNMNAPVWTDKVHVYDHNIVSVPVHVPVAPPMCGGNTIYNSLMTSCQECPAGTVANGSRSSCILAMSCGTGEVPMQSGQGCQICQPGTHPDPTGTFCQGPPPVEVFFAPTPQPQPMTDVTFHPEAVVTPHAVVATHANTHQVGHNMWESSARPTTHWEGSGGFGGGAIMPAAGPLMPAVSGASMSGWGAPPHMGGGAIGGGWGHY